MAVTAIKIEPEISTEIKIENDGLYIEQLPELIAFDVKQEFSCSPKREYVDSNSECYDNNHLGSDYDNTNNCKVKLEESSDYANEFEIGCTGQVANHNIPTITANCYKAEQIDVFDSDAENVQVKYNIPQAEDLDNEEEPELHRCHICNFTTVNKASITRHLCLHSEKMYCEFCGKSFSRRAYLNSHLLSNHKNTIIALKMDFPFKIYSCDQCKYETLMPANLKRHKRSHENKPNTSKTKNRAKNMCCDKCDYKTDSKSHLSEHVRIHSSDVKPFVCPSPSCIKMGFNRKIYLDRHILRHHANDGDLVKIMSSEIYKCPECPYRTTCLSDKKTHSITHLTVKLE